MASITRRTMLKAAAAVPLLSRAAFAQSDWPSRPVRFVLPFPPGGGADTVVRAVTDRIAELIGQPVVVENRTGGNAIVAASLVAQAPPDGYTFLWDGNNQLSNRALVKDIPFDYRTAFVPVTMTARFPHVLAVRVDFPARTFDEFIAHARANPGKVSVGTPPSGGMGHLAVKLLEARADIKLIHTPYRGGPDATRDVMGGQIDAVMLTTSTIRPALQAGKARILAVTSAQRVPLHADVPAIAERFTGYDMDDWNGLFAPAGTPEPIVSKMNAAVAQALRDPAVVARIAPSGTILGASTPAEIRDWLARQRDIIEKIIRDGNITLTSTTSNPVA
jgi:tripartite-type tricarboxylate transporter receptor subunit TctC